ncbi:MAG TPA: class I SAM-dependent methyltransferase [Methanotrichaceae archaeon]|nr:class I SAM-dependent methyltransferase [Methanotrichaceae archaeon]
MIKDKYVGKWVKPNRDSLKAQVGRRHDQSMEVIAGDIIDRLEIGPGDRVLDLCCGNGMITKIVSETASEVYGVDFSEYLLGMARERMSADNIHYCLENALNIERIFPKGFFDKSYCYFSFQHIDPKDAPMFIKGLMEVTSQEGMALIGDIPDKRRKWDTYYNTWHLKAMYICLNAHRILTGREGEDYLGWWYHPDQLSEICTNQSLCCQILDQDPGLPYSEFRFDILITNQRSA